MNKSNQVKISTVRSPTEEVGKGNKEMFTFFLGGMAVLAVVIIVIFTVVCVVL